jgi:hypothetical protein
VSTQRIVIEDGAFFKGSIDILGNKENREPRTDLWKPIAPAAAMGSGSESVGAGTNLSAAGESQSSFSEPK